jgi:hypothetical protein
MGNTNKHIKEKTMNISHPGVKSAKLIEDKDRRYLEVVFKTQEEEYKHWHDSLRKADCREPAFLYLPTKVEYSSDGGLCGNTGQLTVIIFLHRTSILTSLIFFLSSSRSIRAKENLSRNLSSGMRSSPSLLL